MGDTIMTDEEFLERMQGGEITEDDYRAYIESHADTIMVFYKVDGRRRPVRLGALPRNERESRIQLFMEHGRIPVRIRQPKEQDEQAALFYAMLVTQLEGLDDDFQPWGKRDRDTDWGPDCGCGCQFFAEINGSSGVGVCTNPDSPRYKRLTHERQGCREFVRGDD